MFVSDGNNKRIQKFDLNGKFLSKWGNTGKGGEFEFVGPGSIAVDSHGNVYVLQGSIDPDGNEVIPGYMEHVQVFDGDGKPL